MDSRERVSNTSNAAGAGAIQLLPHLSSSRVGASAGGSSASSGGIVYRNAVQANGNVSRASTLERPVGRTNVVNSHHSQMANGSVAGGGGHHNLVTTQADVEHHQQQHHQPQQHPQLQQQRPDMRSPQPMAEPFPVFDTNQVRKIRDINIQRNLQMKLNAVQPI